MKTKPLPANIVLLKRVRCNILLAAFLCCAHSASAQYHSFFADTSTNLIDGAGGSFGGIQPGDTVFLHSGTRNKLLIRNVVGLAGKPVVFMNHSGAVAVSTDSYYGVSINNCRFIRFSGRGDSSNFYGIQIKKVTNGCGIGISAMSSDVEVDHVSIENCSTAGIYAKTDPDCSLKATRSSFTQFNTSIHHNYIFNAGNEGMYIGSSYYAGVTLNCNGTDTLVLPAVLNGVQVYNNIVDHTGWDGIQVSSAPLHCQVYNNTITFDSQSETDNQMSGILLGGGSKCDCNNNLIKNGKGDGIENHGLGGNRLFNNIIVNAGRSYLPNDATRMKHGIFVSDVSAIADSAVTIFCNDIINPKSDGIRFQSIKSRHNLVAANLIINPGNYFYYPVSQTSASAADAFVMLPNKAADVQQQNNFFSLSAQEAGLDTATYHILPGAPLINSGGTAAVTAFDFFYNRRPVGGLYDIGAVEYYGGVDTLLHSFNKPLLYPNPAKDVLRVKCLLLGDTPLTFLVYSATGSPVLQLTKPVVPGMQLLEFSIQQLPAGTYLFCIQQQGETQYGKFVKQ